MALHLPCIHIPRTGDRTPSRPELLSAEDLEALLAADRFVGGQGATERHLPLERQRWAVGRSSREGTIWRIGGAEHRDRLGHPAWLWTEPALFTPDAGPSVRAPFVMPLRGIIREAMPLCGTVRATCESLAATIAALRRRRKPVALVPAEGAVSPEAARWFALGILTMLPSVSRRRLRLSTCELEPDPEHWDFVIAEKVPRGFVTIRADLAPAVEDDIVAAYLLDRLLARDPEAVEAAAWMLAGDGEDPWGEGVRAHLRGGVPGVSALDETLLRDDPERAVRAVLRRLQSGAAVSGRAVADLVAVTLKTSDPRPWRLLKERDVADRERALRALLTHLEPKAATAPLLRTIGSLGEVGAAIGPWSAFLVRCLRDSDASATARELLESALGDGASLDPADRASLWQEIVLSHVERGDPDEAASALLSPMARQLVTEGAGATVAHGYLALPAHFRTSGLTRELVDLLASGPGSDTAMAILYRGLLMDGASADVQRAAASRALLEHWARLRCAPEAPTLPRDRLLRLIRGTPQALQWAQLVGESAPWDRLRSLVAPVVTDDPVLAEQIWTVAEERFAARRGVDARQRLLDIGGLLPDAGPALATSCRELLDEVLAEGVYFPDDALATLAAELAEVPGVTPVWMWLAITAGSPTAFAEETVDGTVIAFCEAPPRSRADRVAALRCVEGLAFAQVWTALEQARWIVRLAMAPDGDRTGFAEELSEHLLRAIAEREEDGLRRLTVITRAFLELGLQHPALRMFLGRLLPRIWVPGDVPQGYVDAIEMGKLPRAVLDRWREALGLTTQR